MACFEKPLAGPGAKIQKSHSTPAICEAIQGVRFCNAMFSTWIPTLCDAISSGLYDHSTIEDTAIIRSTPSGKSKTLYLLCTEKHIVAETVLPTKSLERLKCQIVKL